MAKTAAKAASPATRAAELRKELNHHNHLYYVEAAPVISDRDFDRLLQELADLEKAHPELASPDSPTQRVGGAPIPGFVEVAHKVPMLSIENSYDADDLRKFDADVKKALGAKAAAEYMVELKIDGVSMSITYENGLLARAVTRGSGEVGADVTHNVRTIGSVPLRLAGDNPPAVFEVRGEVYMTRGELARINVKRVADGEKPYENTRNTTAGTLKLLDPKECAKRKLSFFAYGTGVVEGVAIKSQVELFDALRRFGFPVNPHTRLCRTIDEVIAYCDEWDERRGDIAYDTDGMVVKVNDFAQRERIGYTAKVPKWAKAYKYEAEQGICKLTGVEFSIGKFGELTPVALFDPPVRLANTNVGRASMHNASWVEKMGVRYGDTVVVEKKGEIIPQVVGVVTESRAGTEKPITWPEACPACGGPVIKEETATSYNFVCDNPAMCPGQIGKRVEGFARRTRMDIAGLGREVAKQLVAGRSPLVKSVADLYRVTKEQLLNLDGFAELSAQKLIDGIAASKNRGLARLLAALSIYSVGESMAELLADEFLNIDAIVAAKPEELAKVKGFGPKRAQFIREYFDSEAGKKNVMEFKALGLKLTHDKKAAPAGGLPLAGKTVVVTGTLVNYDRVTIEQAIKDAGGKASGSVSKKTDFVLAGEKAGSKLDKAKELGVKVITEDEFRTMIGAA
ncbi:nad-dependent dna ligase : DNA ligase OS=Blastopirellula marina DSM 3645 GN=ligA PE=3 SV=1: DNA_ligase_aden: DNA_ligase_OB: HHH_2: BRCT [Gemmataceae bacterium]|nr:nad-dependent dna ligase : DNA ligase OS=Blastopirellula marina DSM 3645 GN=ligA PE=3 SV=1: DNA_ligase_aden: DNA_ligase_OB: HHH_2: BRCT [Gemmataceae bacterium]VTT97855.1 nad-dependent dna ligase : DNA ligase OS=Blastopirellula marina DSM 3645 GN=ligA PE=3 SV=1: DNA_ligase_aden: DNA_ligase_OB: HHH_2: BRCT [Gemmataceae bacterium]